MRYLGTEVYIYLEISTCDPLNYKMEIPSLLYLSVWENPSEYKGLYTHRQLFMSVNFHLALHLRHCSEGCGQTACLRMLI